MGKYGSGEYWVVCSGLVMISWVIKIIQGGFRPFLMVVRIVIL